MTAWASARLSRDAGAALPLPAEKGYIREVDRRRAIELALRLGRPGDMIFIGGKGHETYQIVGTLRHSFDDRQVVREYLCSEQ